MRCVHESQFHEQNSFITLTYSDENLPENGTVIVAHWQEFAKRLRRKCGPFRFMHCGEYGKEKERPHYHALLFGLDFSEDREPTEKIDGNQYYESETLTERWGKGIANISDLTFESAAYVARYNIASKHGERAEKYYRGRKREYITMSRRPGLGAKWIQKWKDDVYPSDELVMNGVKTRPPKFYDREIEKHNEEIIRKMKAKRKRNAMKYREDQTTERLETREIVDKAKHSRKNRRI